MKKINDFVLEKLKLNNQSKLKDNKFWILISIKYNSSIINDFNHIYCKRMIFTYSKKQDEMIEIYLININEFKDFFLSLSFLKRHFTDFILYEVPDELPISKTSTKDEIDKYVERNLYDLIQASDKWYYDNLKKRDITYFIDLNNYNINEKLVLNNQSKLNQSKLNKWVLCRVPLFNEESKKFMKQYEDRTIIVWSRQLNVYSNLYLITVNEAINFWGLDHIQTSPNKVSKTICFLYKLPVPIKNDATDEDIKTYIKDHYKVNNDIWDPIDLEKYFIDYEND